MKLELDVEALRALFPPGSEAEAQLRRQVTQDLVHRLALKDIKQLSLETRDEVRSLVKQAVRECGLIECHDGDILVSKSLQLHITDIVRDQFKRTINDAVTLLLSEDCMNEIRETVTRRLENRLDVLVTQGLHDTIREQVRVTMKGAF